MPKPILEEFLDRANLRSPKYNDRHQLLLVRPAMLANSNILLGKTGIPLPIAKSIVRHKSTTVLWLPIFGG